MGRGPAHTESGPHTRVHTQEAGAPAVQVRPRGQHPCRAGLTQKSRPLSFREGFGRLGAPRSGGLFLQTWSWALGTRVGRAGHNLAQASGSPRNTVPPPEGFTPQNCAVSAPQAGRRESRCPGALLAPRLRTESRPFSPGSCWPAALGVPCRVDTAPRLSLPRTSSPSVSGALFLSSQGPQSDGTGVHPPPG